MLLLNGSSGVLVLCCSFLHFVLCAWCCQPTDILPGTIRNLFSFSQFEEVGPWMWGQPTGAGVKVDVTVREEWMTSPWEREGKESGRDRKRKLSEKLLCIFLKSYKVIQTKGMIWCLWRLTCRRQRSKGEDGHQFVCSGAQLMTTSTINTFWGLGPRATLER